MAFIMHKGKVSELVDHRSLEQRLKDGWTFAPSETNTTKPKPRSPKEKVKVTEVEVIKATDLGSPEDLLIEEEDNGN